MLVVLVQHVTKHFAEIVNGVLGLVLVYRYQGIDVVQRVEQEMRVELAFQVLKFRFCLRLCQLLFFIFRFVPSPCHFDRHAKSHGKGHEHHVPGDKHVAGWFRKRIFYCL